MYLLQFTESVRKGGVLMSLKKIAICAAALVAATMFSQLAQAAGKGATGVGHIPVPSGSGVPGKDPGHSANAPGDIKHDKGIPAKESAPGDVKNDKKGK